MLLINIIGGEMMISEEMKITIKTLYEKGYNKSQISRMLKIDRKGLQTSTLKFNRCKKKRTAVLTHCIKIAVLIWWRRGVSNPCPKADQPDFLRA